jgi:hypothetical protein
MMANLNDIAVMKVLVSDDAILRATLNGLGIEWQPLAGNGAGPVLQVEMNDLADAKLEALIHALAELRWHYEPGRSLQLELFDREALDGPH